MPTYNYKAKDQDGVLKTGTIEAVSMNAASTILHGHGLTLLELSAEEISGFLKYLPFLNRVPRKEIVLFSRQLSTLINARVPILSSFEILTTQITNKNLQRAVANMMDEIEGGKSLSEALGGYPNIFSNLYMNMVKAGELSGTLDQALLFLANQEEKDYDLVSKVRGALTYPIFIISAIIVVGFLMFVFVLPQMISVLQEAGAELPITTRILIFVTNFINHYWGLLIILIIGGTVSFEMYIRSSGGRIIWDALKLKMPVIGKLLTSIYMDRFSRNLATLIHGGIPIVRALNTVAEIVNNSIYRHIIMATAKDVETGKSIAKVFASSPEIPRIVTQMVRVGEQTGSLDEILNKLADFYDKEVERTLSILTTLIEPIVMILLGLAVAVMVAGIILPIYNLANVT